ncbi:MAG: hypothetical protein HS116_10095 [Planctomycetes bacterium]|nr:hypothetical protein [Planctomycetota bacterium]
MTVWESIRSARAEAAAAVFGAVGVRVDLIGEAGAAEDLAAYVEQGGAAFERSLARHGVEEERVVHLPRQSGFDGSVRAGDVVVLPAGGATKYVIRAVDCDAHEAVFRLRVVRAAAPVGLGG